VLLEVEVVEAHANLRAQPVVPALVVRHVDRRAGLRHVVLAHRFAALRLRRQEQADRLDLVPTQLDPGAQRTRPIRERGRPRVLVASAVDAPVVVLLELVAIVLVERVGEVGDQFEVVVHRIGVRRPAAAIVALRPGVHGQAVAVRLAAARRVDVAEARDAERNLRALAADRALRDLVRAVPPSVVTHRRQRKAAVGRAARVLDEAVDLAEVLRQVPGPVRRRIIEGAEQRAAADLRCRGDQCTVVVVLAEGQARQRAVEFTLVGDVGGAGRGEVALVGEVRALAITNLLDQFRNQEIDVGVALAVGVRGHVDGNAVDARREIRAVVEVEAAQEVLVRLAVAAVLRDDQARHDLEDFARAQDRPALELDREHDTLAGGARFADQADPGGRDDDLLERRRRRNARAPRDAGERQRDQHGDARRGWIAHGVALAHHFSALVTGRRRPSQRSLAASMNNLQ